MLPTRYLNVYVEDFLYVYSFQSEGNLHVLIHLKTLIGVLIIKEVMFAAENNNKQDELQINEQLNESKAKRTPEHNATEQTDGPKCRKTLTTQTTKATTTKTLRTASIKKATFYSTKESRKNLHSFSLYHCQRYFTQNMGDSVKIRKKKLAAVFHVL